MPAVSVSIATIRYSIKTPSSGEERSLKKENLEKLREFDYIKMVIQNEIDFSFALEFLKNNLVKCGIGLCDSCSVDGFQVCVDGPVFNMKQLNGMTEFGTRT